MWTGFIFCLSVIIYCKKTMSFEEIKTSNLVGKEEGGICYEKLEIETNMQLSNEGIAAMRPD